MSSLGRQRPGIIWAGWRARPATSASSGFKRETLPQSRKWSTTGEVTWHPLWGSTHKEKGRVWKIIKFEAKLHKQNCLYSKRYSPCLWTILSILNWCSNLQCENVSSADVNNLKRQAKPHGTVCGEVKILTPTPKLPKGFWVTQLSLINFVSLKSGSSLLDSLSTTRAHAHAFRQSAQRHCWHTGCPTAPTLQWEE